MNIGTLKNEVIKLQENFQQLQSVNYDIFRDEKSNLHLAFKNGERLKLPIIEFRPYQYEVQSELFIKNKNRFFLVRPRRAGKEVESWNLLIQGAICQPGLYLMIYPSNVRGRIVLWDGAITLPDKSSLRFLDMIPKELIAKRDEGEMKIVLKNGAVIRILGSDTDPDKLRGINARGAVFAEFAFQDPRVYQILMPVFRQNGGWIILQTTFDGMNHAYRYMQEVKENPEWYCRTDSAETLFDEKGNRYITDEMIDEDRKAGMAEFRILQEYYSIVQLNQESMYFSVEMSQAEEDGRLCELQPLNAPLHTSWDIGLDDNTAITLFQIDDKGCPYIIHFFESRNKTFEYYIDEIKNYARKNNLTMGKHFAPHDGRKRDFYTKSNNYQPKDIVGFGSELGLEFICVNAPAKKIYAIQAMRQMIYRCRINKKSAARLIDALCSYSKEFDEKSGMYRDYPKHDWASHPVDSFQTMTLAFQEGRFQEKKAEPISYIGTKAAQVVSYM